MSRKIPRCVLHIGTPKTGSTSIQNFLKTNSDALQELGIAEAKRLATKLALAFTSFENRRKFLFKSNIKTKAQHEETKIKAISMLESIIQNCDENIETLVLSSEQFYGVSNTEEKFLELKNILDQYFDKVDIVGLFRTPIEYCKSTYNESIKNAYKGSFDHYVDTHLMRERWKYNQNCNSWSSAFGADHCYFAVFNSITHGNYDAVHHFCVLAGLKVTHLINPTEERKNTRMSGRLMTAYRLINILVPMWKVDEDSKRSINPLNKRLKGRIRRVPFLNGGRTLELTPGREEQIRSVTQAEFDLFLQRHVRNIPPYEYKPGSV